MKKTLLGIGVILALAVPVTGYTVTVYCTNCSDRFTQALERATGLDQLVQLQQQVQQSVQQTTQQITMVRNMIQNTMQLPSSLRSELAGQLSQLGRLTGQLQTQRGDYTALAQVFNTLYPAKSTFANLSSASTPAEIEAANRQYREHQDKWSESVDQASMATFQQTGRQLQDLSDGGQLESYVQSLLDSPDGQMQAMQAGNQLAALQLQEQRKLRALLATSAQSTLTNEMDEKKYRDQIQEDWRKATNTDKLKGADRLDEPL